MLSLEIPVEFHYTLRCHFCREGRNTQFTMSLLGGNCHCVLAKCRQLLIFSHNRKDRPQRQTEIEEYELTKVAVK